MDRADDRQARPGRTLMSRHQWTDVAHAAGQADA